MVIFVALLLLVSLYQCKPNFGKGFYADYASIYQTRSINGVFSMLILMSHTFAKVSSGDVFDAVYAPVRAFLGQFMVVPFLFYSGYGIMSSLASKEDYLKNFPRERLLKLLIRFTVITLIYVLLHWILGNKYSLWHILLSFFGITSIGNGGWYILSTFVFYIAVIVCFNLFRRSRVTATVAVMLCLILLTVIEIVIGFPSYYYSTTIFLAVGMVYFLLKQDFDRYVMKNVFVWSTVFLVGLAGFTCLKRLVAHSVLFYPVWCGFGMLMILCVTMKVRFQNKFLVWLGRTTFFCFTLQGIPQIVFTKYLDNNYVIYVLVIICSLLLTAVADVSFSKGERIICRRRKETCLRS